MKVFAENRKAKNSYDFHEFYEAGVVLSGPETKSVRNGGISIVDAFAIIENEEAYVMEMNIEPYKYSNNADYDPNIMEKVYKAHHRFGKLLHDDKFQIKFRLEPGDIFSFNNRRLLHGRTEYNPNSGHRHLQGYYMDRDEIIGRLKYLKNRITSTQ